MFSTSDALCRPPIVAGSASALNARTVPLVWSQHQVVTSKFVPVLAMSFVHVAIRVRALPFGAALFGSLLGNFLSLARAAVSLAVNSLCVLLAVLVAPRAMSLFEVRGHASSTKRVFSSGHQFEVIGANARRSAAQVVKHYSLGNPLDKEFVGKTMGHPNSSERLELHMPVALHCSIEQPAVIRKLDLPKEPCDGVGFLPPDRSWHWSEVTDDESASLDIHTLTDWFQMLRPNAVRDTAQVIKNEPVRDRSDHKLPRPAMGLNNPLARLEVAMPIWRGNSASPEPAVFREVHLRKEPVYLRRLGHRYRGASSQVAVVVGKTHSVPIGPPATGIDIANLHNQKKQPPALSVSLTEAGGCWRV